MKLEKLHSPLAILLIAVIVFSAMLLPGCRSAGLGASGKVKLSEMEDAALLRYIQECGVTFSKYVDLENEQDVGVIRNMVQELEKDPDHEAPFLSGIVHWIDVYEDLRKVVKIYYGIED